MSESLYIGAYSPSDVENIEKCFKDSIMVDWLPNEVTKFGFKHQNIVKEKLNLFKLGLIAKPSVINSKSNSIKLNDLQSMSLIKDIRSYRYNILSKDRILNLPVFSGTKVDINVTYPILFSFLDDLNLTGIKKYIILVKSHEGLLDDPWSDYFAQLPKYIETDIIGIKEFLQNYVFQDTIYYSPNNGYLSEFETSYIFKVYKDLGI